MFSQLLIGCGSRRIRQVSLDGNVNFENVTTLDINSDHKPDLVHDLCTLPLPFGDESFDEIHAYEVLEHTGRQGDCEFFFDQFSDFWRMLKPNGTLHATVPWWQGIWAWGDPSHTRVIQPETLSFLHQPKYTSEIGVTAMSDFRHIYQADFDMIHGTRDDVTFSFILRAIKPSRITKP